MRLKPSHLALLTFAAACVGVFAYTAWRLRQPADLTPAQLLPPLQWMLEGARPRDQPSPPVHPVPESPAAASAECSRRHGIGP